MRSFPKYNWTSSTPDNWVLKIVYFPENNTFITSNSNGFLLGYLVENLSDEPIFKVKAHESSINDIQRIDANTLASCSTDGIKIWDLRSPAKPPIHLLNAKNSNFLSLAYSENMLAGGTELLGVDAELHLWDLRNPEQVVKSFIDSHHDDITHLQFHPTISNYLMSGSTDGYVIIHDLNQEEEEDSLHQVINYASVHSCNFLQDTRISVLSHMETLAFCELNNTDYINPEEPDPTDLGDVRQLWPDCEYVVDVNPAGYVSYGANSQQKLTLCPFNSKTEKFQIDNPVWFPLAHGEEIVRDVFVIPNTKSALTCGEDGNIKLWEMPFSLDTSEKASDEDVSMSDDEPKEKKVKKEKKEKKDKKEKKEKKDKKDKKEKKEKEEKKEKKEKKDKKDKKEKKEKKEKSKKDKKKKDVRFKPY